MTPKSTNFPIYVFSRCEEKAKFAVIYFGEHLKMIIYDDFIDINSVNFIRD